MQLPARMFVTGKLFPQLRSVFYTSHSTFRLARFCFRLFCYSTRAILVCFHLSLSKTCVTVICFRTICRSSNSDGGDILPRLKSDTASMGAKFFFRCKASLGELPFSLVRDFSWSYVRVLSSGIALPVCGLEIDGNAIPHS